MTDEREDALAVLHLRNQFYRDGQRKLTLIVLMTFASLFFLLALLVYVVKNPPPPRYFQVDNQGRLIPSTPLDQPNIQDNEVLNFAQDVALALYTYNYRDYRQQIQAASSFFTESGFNGFQASLSASNNLERVVASKMLVWAKVRDTAAVPTPQILKQGVENGVYFWDISFPMQVKYESRVANQGGADLSLASKIRVVRVSYKSSLRGIAVDSFSACDVTESDCKLGT